MKMFILAVVIVMTTLTSGLILGSEASRGLGNIAQTLTNLVTK